MFDFFSLIMTFINKIARSFREARRVISISRKPTKNEFVSILKICALGIAVIGVIGFVIQFIYQYLIQAVI